MASNTVNMAKIKKVLLFTVLWYLIAHGYRMSNLLYYHDSLINATRSDVGYQISLGRFMQPLVILLSGSITSAWLISVAAILFLGLSVWLICEIAGLESTKEIGFVSAVLVCNNVLTWANYAYIPWLDIYAMALFFAVLGYWFLRKGGVKFFALGVASVVISMGLYQAYVSVALTLALVVCIRMLYNGESLRSIAGKRWHIPAGFMTGGILYYAVYKVMLVIRGVEESTGYNGLGNLTEFGEESFFSIIGVTYSKFFYFLFDAGVYASGKIHGVQIQDMLGKLVIAINVFVIIVTVLGLIRINILRKTAVISWLTQAVLVILFPLAANFVCLMSKGMVYYLMVYAFLLLYVFALIVVKDNMEITNSQKGRQWQPLLLVPVLWLVLNNMVYSNQVYVKIHMSEEAAHSVMTRIVADIEKTEGYLWGQTPVAFLGNFGSSPYIPRDAYLDQINTMALPLTNTSAYYPYFVYHLGSNVNVTELPAGSDVGADMPCFPEQGYIKFVDGILIVRIS